MSIASPIQGIPWPGSANWFISIARYGGARRDRTDDLMLAKHALYQLSYGPNIGSRLRRAEVAVRRLRQARVPRGMVGPGRLELPTSRLSGVRSNQAELRAYGSETPGSRLETGFTLGLAIAPPDLTAGGDWKEKRRRRYPAYL
jgi:hypothetical protein